MVPRIFRISINKQLTQLSFR